MRYRKKNCQNVGNIGPNFLIATPIDAWRLAQFGADSNTPSIAGNAATPAGDGVSNLMKYALGLDPHAVANSTSLPAVPTENGHLSLTFKRPVGVSDATYIVEVSDDLLTWNVGSSYSANGTVPSNSYTTEVLNSTANGIQTITVQDNASSPGAARRFIRLKVTNP